MNLTSVYHYRVDYHSCSTIFWPQTKAVITLEKIRSFSNLKEGWRYGAGKGFEPAVLATANRLNQAAINVGLSETDAFPGRDGDVSVTIYDKPNYYQFRIWDPNRITFSHEKNEDLIHEVESMTLVSALDQIQKLQEWSWNNQNLFFTFTSATLMKHAGGSGVRPSKTPVTAVESPLLKKTVFFGQQVAYASTRDNSTTRLPSSRQFSGNSTQRHYSLIVS